MTLEQRVDAIERAFKQLFIAVDYMRCMLPEDDDEVGGVNAGLDEAERILWHVIKSKPTT